MGNKVKSAQPCKVIIIFINIQSANYPLKPQAGDLPVFNPCQCCLMCFQHKSISKAVLDVWHHKTISWMSCPAQGRGCACILGGMFIFKSGCLFCKFSSPKN